MCLANKPVETVTKGSNILVTNALCKKVKKLSL
jgi:hypothetical protein